MIINVLLAVGLVVGFFFGCNEAKSEAQKAWRRGRSPLRCLLRGLIGFLTGLVAGIIFCALVTAFFVLVFGFIELILKILGIEPTVMSRGIGVIAFWGVFWGVIALVRLVLANSRRQTRRGLSRGPQ